jgi:hypothetical protein
MRMQQCEIRAQRQLEQILNTVDLDHALTGAMRGSASFAGWVAGGTVARDVLGTIFASVFILNSPWPQMLFGPDSQLGAPPRRMRPLASSFALMSRKSSLRATPRMGDPRPMDFRLDSTWASL